MARNFTISHYPGELIFNLVYEAETEHFRILLNTMKTLDQEINSSFENRIIFKIYSSHDNGNQFKTNYKTFVFNP